MGKNRKSSFRKSVQSTVYRPRELYIKQTLKSLTLGSLIGSPPCMSLPPFLFPEESSLTTCSG
jgi:hypothetical protein